MTSPNEINTSHNSLYILRNLLEGANIIDFNYRALFKDYTGQPMDSVVSKLCDKLELPQDKYQTYCFLGIKFLYENELDEAAYCFNKSLQLDEDGLYTHLSLSLLHVAQEEYKECASSITKVLSIFNTNENWQAHDYDYVLAMIYNSLFSYLHKHYPSSMANYFSWILMSYGLWQAKDEEKAYEFFHKAITKMKPTEQTVVSNEILRPTFRLFRSMPKDMKRNAEENTSVKTGGIMNG